MFAASWMAPIEVLRGASILGAILYEVPEAFVPFIPAEGPTFDEVHEGQPGALVHAECVEDREDALLSVREGLPGPEVPLEEHIHLILVPRGGRVPDLHQPGEGRIRVPSDARCSCS